MDLYAMKLNPSFGVWKILRIKGVFESFSCIFNLLTFSSIYKNKYGNAIRFKCTKRVQITTSLPIGIDP